MTLRYLLAAPFLILAQPAAAQLPDAARSMIEAAIASGDEAQIAAVFAAARTAFSQDEAAINDIWNGYLAQREARAALAEAEREEAIRQAGLLDEWSGEGQIGAFQSSGNTDAVGVTAALELAREGIDWTHTLRAAVDYRRNEGRTQREQFLLAYEPRYRINEALFAFALAQYERDRFQGFSGRYAGSAGLGYQIADTERLQLSVQAGPAYRRTEFVDGTSRGRLAGLVATDFAWQIAERVALTQDLDFIYDGDSTLVAATGLEAGIADRLTARLSWTLEYDSAPPAGAVDTDTLTRFTLIYGF